MNEPDTSTRGNTGKSLPDSDGFGDELADEALDRAEGRLCPGCGWSGRHST